MKKHFYLLLLLLTPTPSMAMWSWFFGNNEPTIKSAIIASSLVLGYSNYDKKRSLRLHQAVEQNNTTNALQLITNPQVDINAKVDYGTHASHKGWTPLIRCTYEGDKSLRIVQALLKHKEINVNLPTKNGLTPLIICCWKGNQSLDIAQNLLKHKEINVNLQEGNGNTPLIQCYRKGDKSLPIAQALLKHQHINVNLQNKLGRTPLDKIIEQIQENKKYPYWMTKNYTYVQLWNLLVAQGGVLDKCKVDYENLEPSDFKEPHKGYVRLIKQNPPKN